MNTSKDRPLVAPLTPASSSVPSQRGIARKSSALPPPRKSPPALHVSAPPPYVSQKSNLTKLH
ncbi:hypothetical protein Bca4012_039997 [Brassica carinata]